MSLPHVLPHNRTFSCRFPTFFPTFLLTPATRGMPEKPMIIGVLRKCAQRVRCRNLLGRQDIHALLAPSLLAFSRCFPIFFPTFRPGRCRIFGGECHSQPCSHRLFMLISITETAKRLGWHRTTVWRKARTDSTFPAVVYIGPKSPRINSDELDRWVARSKSINSDYMYISPDLLRGKSRGPQIKSRKKAA